MSRVLVVGAGIGGLAAAIALRRVGCEVTVAERAPALREVGAGISLWSNAAKALRALGLGDELHAQAHAAASATVHDWRGRRLAHTPMADFARRFGAPSYTMHRADLQAMLLAACGEQHVRLGHAVADLAEGDAYDLVVGADGVNSAVKALLHGPFASRAAGYRAWRGVVAMTPHLVPPGGSFLFLGKGRQFGGFPLTRGRLYWFATTNAPAGGLAELYADAHPLLLAIFAATDPDAVLLNDIKDRDPSPAWGRGKVTLLGDAAHASTPNLGQGACMALEDAVALAAAVKRHGAVPEALRAYERARYPRTRAVTLESRRMGKVFQVENPLLLALRDAAIRAAPASAMLHNLARYLAYRPEELG